MLPLQRHAKQRVLEEATLHLLKRFSILLKRYSEWYQTAVTIYIDVFNVSFAVAIGKNSKTFAWRDYFHQIKGCSNLSRRIIVGSERAGQSPLWVKSRCSQSLRFGTDAAVSLMNVINIISPYKHLGMWVFDDPRVGLAQEPFVAGADTMIDRVTANIPNANHGLTLIFSASPFPGHQHRLDWRRAEAEGNWYHSEELKLEGWLCPALLLYFKEAPKHLYVQVKARS